MVDKGENREGLGVRLGVGVRRGKLLSRTRRNQLDQFLGDGDFSRRPNL